MSKNAIVVENLSKCYSIGHRSSGGRYQYMALRDMIAHEFRNFARKAVDVARSRQVIQGTRSKIFGRSRT